MWTVGDVWNYQNIPKSKQESGGVLSYLFGKSDRSLQVENSILSQQLTESQQRLDETQSQLQEKQVQLQVSDTRLQETQSQLEETQSQLQETQVQLQHSQQNFQDSQQQTQVLVGTFNLYTYITI